MFIHSIGILIVAVFFGWCVYKMVKMHNKTEKIWDKRAKEKRKKLVDDLTKSVVEQLDRG